MPDNSCILPRVAIWLVPRQSDRSILDALIADLAGRFSAPEFVPHMTLCTCRRSSLQKALTVTAVLAGRCSPLTLRTDGLASGDRLTRALFARLVADTALQRLRGALQSELPQSPVHDFEPHVSLLYQFLPLAVRKRLTREAMLPLPEIGFDQIRAVAIPATIHAKEQLSGWQTLLSCRLAPNAIAGTI